MFTFCSVYLSILYLDCVCLLGARGSPVGLQINEVLSPVFSDTKDSQHELMDRWDTVCWLPEVKTYDKVNTESDIYLRLLSQIQNMPAFPI